MIVFHAKTSDPPGYSWNGDGKLVVNPRYRIVELEGYSPVGGLANNMKEGLTVSVLDSYDCYREMGPFRSEDQIQCRNREDRFEACRDAAWKLRNALEDEHREWMRGQRDRAV